MHRKCVDVDGTPVNLLLWNLDDSDEFQLVRPSYLRGMSGYALVIDENDSESAERALRLHQLARKTVGDVPFVTLILDQATVTESTNAAEATTGLIDECFQRLAREIVYGR